MKIHSRSISQTIISLTIAIIVLLTLWWIGKGIQTQETFAAEETTLSGTIYTTWIDRKEENISEAFHTLITDNDERIGLNIPGHVLDRDVGTENIHGEEAEVTISGSEGSFATVQDEGVQTVTSISIQPDLTVGDYIDTYPLLGTKAWFIIPCKFADHPEEPATVDSFLTIMGNEEGNLGHYWKELSYDTMNIDGTSVTSQWYASSNPFSFYDTDGDGRVDYWYVSTLMQDCIDTVAESVDLFQFYGVNIMMNTDIGYPVGGTSGADLDGDGNMDRMVGYTILSPPDYGRIDTIAHEMGHGFGFPHSFAGDQSYGSRWDIMSGGGYIHTISYNKMKSEWIDSSKIYVAPEESSETVTIERLALPPGEAGNYLAAIVPFGDTGYEFYTVELRLEAGYDENGLPGEAVIIHKVDDYNELAFVVDEDGNGNYNDEGAMWRYGEEYIDYVNDIKIEIFDAGPPPDRDGITSFDVTITRMKSTDIAIEILDNYDPLEMTETAIHTITARNLGPNASTNTVATSILPDTIDIISVPETCSQSSSGGNITVECPIGVVTLQEIRNQVSGMFITPQIGIASIDQNGDGISNSFDFAILLADYSPPQASNGLLQPVHALVEDRIFPAGETEIYTIEFTKATGGVVEHNITITAEENDLYPDNNSTSEETSFISITDLVPEMIYPQDGEVMGYTGDYRFVAVPVAGDIRYEYRLYQGGTFINESNFTSSGSDFMISKTDPLHQQFVEGPLEVRLRILTENGYSQNKIFNLTLETLTDIPQKVQFIKPVQNEHVAFNSCYTVKVQPIYGANFYRFGYRQYGIIRFDNFIYPTDERTSSTGSYTLYFMYTDVQVGNVDIYGQAMINGQWTQEETVTVYVDPNIPPPCR